MRVEVLPLVVLAACAAPPAAERPEPPADAAVAATLQVAEEADFLQRLAESLATPDGEDGDTVMNSLEHLLPAWQNEQRRQREQPLERIISVKVVAHFDDVLRSLREGPRERRLVAAWALGFSRVPPNDLGIASPHDAALPALLEALGSTDDDLLRNALLGLWKLGEPATPLPPLLDLMVQHHEPEVRANAALALGTVLTAESAPRAQDGVLVALADSEARVRLHAASVVRRFPSAPATARLEQLLATEPTPLVRAAMAAALGAAGARSSAPLLLPLLGSAREIESVSARQALVAIFGEDRGPDPAAWSDLVR